MPTSEASTKVRSLFCVANHRETWRGRAATAISDALFDYRYGTKPESDAESKAAAKAARQVLLSRVGVGLNPCELSLPPIDWVLRSCLLPRSDPEHGYVVTDNWGKSIFLLCCRYGLVEEARKIWKTFGTNKQERPAVKNPTRASSAPTGADRASEGAGTDEVTSRDSDDDEDHGVVDEPVEVLALSCNRTGLRMLRESVSYDRTRRRTMLSCLEILAIAKYNTNESGCDYDTNEFLSLLVRSPAIRKQVLVPRLQYQMRQKIPTFFHFWTRYECDNAVKAALVLLAELERADEIGAGSSSASAGKNQEKLLDAKVFREALYEYGCGPAITKIDSAFEDLPEQFAKRATCLDMVSWRIKFKEDCGLPSHAGSFIGMRALQRAMEEKKWALVD
ncbi:unnamed protein product [Amoebophrya sp. A120]|nr:unnamed protein product [Amoebophrya sp. A120]|eukprot:GSA120T00012148001.1